MLDPCKLEGGSLVCGEDSTHVVTMWTVPGGWDLSNAIPVNVFFDNGEAAERFAFLHKEPPAMASVAVIDHHGRVVDRFNRLFGDK